MKASAIIYPNLQKPLTVFGIAPRLLCVALLASVVPIIVALMLGLAALSFIIMLVSLAVGVAWAWRKTAQDHHADSVFLESLSFWGRASARHLMAGSGGRKL